MMLFEKQMPNGKRQADILNQIASALNNGYTYSDIFNDICSAIGKSLPPDFSKYNTRIQKNLLAHGTKYYHKELRLMSPLPIINHDIENGTITSSDVEYYLEPRASYTISDLLDYFYSKGMTDEKEYSRNRMAGVFKYLIEKYGIDKILFMIEAANRLYESDQKMFSISDFEGYNRIASDYLDQIKSNSKYSGGDEYVLRKRVLFN